MTSADPPDHTPWQLFAAELGRLRAMLRHKAVPSDLVLAQTRKVARSAYAAHLALPLLIEALTAVVPADAHDVRTLPGELVEAGTMAYQALADRPTDVLLG